MDDLKQTITPERFDAVLFDMDGVLTATAKIHAACWKRMFDAFLKGREGTNDPARPFEIETDYKLYVDGKLRNDGVQSFLESREIHLPYGQPDDSPDMDTICGLGSRKNIMVNEAIKSDGVEVFEGSINFIHQLHSDGIKTAVVSSSKNCQSVLRVAGIENLFDTRVDGEVAAQLDLPSKPAPDVYLKAAEILGVEPRRAVVVEDAISGVQAGRDGGFGLVIGVDRKGDARELTENGAHIVVTDMGEMVR